jgi:hypothetical protein
VAGLEAAGASLKLATRRPDSPPIGRSIDQRLTRSRASCHVEQSFALLHWFRRLRIRWEVRDDTHEAFLRLGCAIICFRRLVNLQLC